MGLHGKLVTVGLCAAVVAGCGAKAGGDGAAPVNTAPAAAPSSQTGALRAGDAAPPAEQTGGFGGKRGVADVVKEGGVWPPPAGSASIGQMQECIHAEVARSRCQVGVGFVFSA